jgi:putative PIN family toxin of toxin-antitoxin system
MPESRPTVLVDTNILISGLVFLTGNEHRILKLAEDKAITLILPQFVLEEARIVFARRFPGHEALLTALLSRAEHTVLTWKEIEESVSLHEKKVRDTKDAPVLAAVLAARPDFAVTGDVALREDMKRCQDVARVTSICSSREFLKEVFKKRR